MFRKILLSLGMMAMLCTAYRSASAQNKENPVPDAVKKLYAFEGSWEGKATMMSNGQSIPLNYYISMRKDAAGWGLSYHERGDIPEATPYLGFGAMGFNTYDNTVHIYTISNYGDVHDHKGTWVTDKKFSLVYSGIMEGKNMVETMECEWVDANNWKLNDVVTLDGQAFQSMTATMHKSKKDMASAMR